MEVGGTAQHALPRAALGPDCGIPEGPLVTGGTAHTSSRRRIVMIESSDLFSGSGSTAGSTL
jgi:hypothetical protein